jgi:hypothetical protein
LPQDLSGLVLIRLLVLARVRGLALAQTQVLSPEQDPPVGQARHPARVQTQGLGPAKGLVLGHGRALAWAEEEGSEPAMASELGLVMDMPAGASTTKTCTSKLLKKCSCSSEYFHGSHCVYASKGHQLIIFFLEQNAQILWDEL